MDLETVWEIREEEIYPGLFGPHSRGIFPLEWDLFQKFGATQIDPRWRHHGIFEFAPTQERASWIYITSGHSNPYDIDEDDEEARDEAGVEFALAVTEPGDWAIRCLQSVLAFDTLLCAGHYPGSEPLGLYDRIPMHAPLNGDPRCSLRTLVITESAAYPSFDTPAGKVTVRSLTAISDKEWELLRQEGADLLIEQLSDAGHHPINDPWRQSLF
ncbi:suppressor of fused domain protein [Rhizobium sp. MHM7A]|uniref:suppressor of fused domain protein n=1 Tax=Rhizobium sp. MHM7A TaxID=2583233 RepID=UPI001105D6AF|nr:suppressor of fused domain protein [Rhizobium sp. MHM7A]TLX17165.1 suppressor of fused domain protein [Rhizobium sp. MHM7A]